MLGRGAWIDTEITPAGKWFPRTPVSSREPELYYSGWMALDHADPSVVYLSRSIDGTFEIEKWVTKDQGRTWSASAVTSHSLSNNIRPIVPRGYEGKADHVLWMRGEYINYTNFRTGICLLTPGTASGR